MPQAIEQEADSVRVMLQKAEAAVARQRSLVAQLRRGEAGSPLAELELRVLEDILRRHKDRLRSLTATPAPHQLDSAGLADAAKRSLASA